MYYYDNETRTQFYESFGETEETVTEYINTVKLWLEKQTHLPEIMGEYPFPSTIAYLVIVDDTRIRNILHLCKFNLEKTKEKIDNYYTLRTKYPNVFNNSNPKLQTLKETMATM